MAAPFRPPWFGNRGVQLLAGVAVAYNLVAIALRLVDGEWGEAFLSFAWTVVFGYVLVESLRFRQQQESDAGQDPATD
ncbi:hypothetical protein GCM10023328_17520 [Modestobacter marinus]|uniref:Uncharacterized protein n=1 Tax=Modestobacter marinus TaxID=477641 RepID=A0A846LJE1_9ACTN|nr:hypothetical protein [Modestobacter marinus]NIH68193.1 hypothetical protein [Modestobacter marinus]GGL79579.1 hypothetical protein GCM10011589_39780 [Modestobacter marinus]